MARATIRFSDAKDGTVKVRIFIDPPIDMNDIGKKGHALTPAQIMLLQAVAGLGKGVEVESAE